MILVLVDATVSEANRERFLALAQRHAETSLAEEGCAAFDIYESPWRRGALRFVEEWRSAEALEEHFASPHMTAFRDQALPLLEPGAVVRRLDAAELS